MAIICAALLCLGSIKRFTGITAFVPEHTHTHKLAQTLSFCPQFSYRCIGLLGSFKTQLLISVHSCIPSDMNKLFKNVCAWC